MCGIAGWINLNSSNTPDTGSVLHSMCETIVHRGPNSEGLWTDESVALGMRRLSIIDLHTGDQPVFSCDKSVVVMMNGELYNYREVRADLAYLVLAQVNMLECCESREARFDLAQLAHRHVQHLQAVAHLLYTRQGCRLRAYQCQLQQVVHVA